MKLLFDRLSQTLEYNMDLRLERGNMLSANLANVDTPGYTPVELKFDEALQGFVASGDDAQRAPEGDVEFDYYSLPDADGNSVDLDHEMSKMAENQLLYRAATRVYNKRMALVKYAIQEGG
jgi:flagellar basal-body rod protein FlgB